VILSNLWNQKPDHKIEQLKHLENNNMIRWAIILFVVSFVMKKTEREILITHLGDFIRLNGEVDSSVTANVTPRHE